MKVEKGLTLLSAAFSGQSAALSLSAVWESDWISLLNFDSSFPVARKVNTHPTVEFYLGRQGQSSVIYRDWTRFFVAATLHDSFS